MTSILRLFRFHKLSILRLNKILTVLLLVQLLLGTLALTGLAVQLYNVQPDLFTGNPYLYLIIAFVVYMYIRLYMFSRRHWWSWCVFTFLSVLAMADGVKSIINWFIPFNYAVLTEELGYLPAIGIILLDVAVLLLRLATLAGLTSRRIAGFHGIGKVAFWVSCALGFAVSILVFM